MSPRLINPLLDQRAEQVLITRPVPLDLTQVSRNHSCCRDNPYRLTGRQIPGLPSNLTRFLTAKQTPMFAGVPKVASVSLVAPFQSVTPWLTKRALLSVSTFDPSRGPSVPQDTVPASVRTRTGERCEVPFGDVHLGRASSCRLLGKWQTSGPRASNRRTRAFEAGLRPFFPVDVSNETSAGNRADACDILSPEGDHLARPRSRVPHKTRAGGESRPLLSPTCRPDDPDSPDLTRSQPTSPASSRKRQVAVMTVQAADTLAKASRGGATNTELASHALGLHGRDILRR